MPQQGGRGHHPIDTVAGSMPPRGPGSDSAELVRTLRHARAVASTRDSLTGPLSCQKSVLLATLCRIPGRESLRHVPPASVRRPAGRSLDPVPRRSEVPCAPKVAQRDFWHRSRWRSAAVGLELARSDPVLGASHGPRRCGRGGWWIVVHGARGFGTCQKREARGGATDGRRSARRVEPGQTYAASASISRATAARSNSRTSRSSSTSAPTVVPLRPSSSRVAAASTTAGQPRFIALPLSR
jgi:hypothetical protein